MQPTIRRAYQKGILCGGKKTITLERIARRSKRKTSPQIHTKKKTIITKQTEIHECNIQEHSQCYDEKKIITKAGDKAKEVA